MYIKNYVESLGLQLGQSIRSDCPSCNNKNTFSATNKDGTLLWRCFHANCNLKGKADVSISRESIITGHINSILTRVPSRNPVIWTIPDYFTYAHLNDRCRKFCEYWKIDNPRFDLRYDPRNDRCVFLLRNHEGILKGATGRLLRYSNNFPKWYIYNRDDSCPFIVCNRNNSNTLLLVEDCISACVGSSIFTSMGILGTNISEEVIRYLLIYKKIYIALDDDATKKSLIIQNRLKAFVDTKILPIKKDIKYYSNKELQELIK